MSYEGDSSSSQASAAVINEYGQILHKLRRYRELDQSKLKVIAGLLASIEKIGSESNVQHRNLRSGLLNYPLLKTFDRTDPVKSRNDFLAEQSFFIETTLANNRDCAFLESVRSRDRAECGVILENKEVPSSSSGEGVLSSDGLHKEVTRMTETMGSLEEVVVYAMCKNLWSTRDVEAAAARASQQLEMEELSIEEIDRYFDDPEVETSAVLKPEGDGGIVRVQDCCENPLYRELQLRCAVTTPMESYDLASLRQQHTQILNRVAGACDQLCPFSIEISKK